MSTTESVLSWTEYDFLLLERVWLSLVAGRTVSSVQSNETGFVTGWSWWGGEASSWTKTLENRLDGYINFFLHVNRGISNTDIADLGIDCWNFIVVTGEKRRTVKISIDELGPEIMFFIIWRLFKECMAGTVAQILKLSMFASVYTVCRHQCQVGWASAILLNTKHCSPSLPGAWVMSQWPNLQGQLFLFFSEEGKNQSPVWICMLHHMDQKDPDLLILDGWLPSAETQPMCTIPVGGMWLSTG